MQKYENTINPIKIVCFTKRDMILTILVNRYTAQADIATESSIQNKITNNTSTGFFESNNTVSKDTINKSIPYNNGLINLEYPLYFIVEAITFFVKKC